MFLHISVSAVYCETLWLSVTCVGQCTMIELFVKEKELKCSDLCVCIGGSSVRRWTA